MALPDLEQRRRALTDHDSTMLVEAGAGSGKTAVMAGRVVLLMANGVSPRNIAAITFTELAAGQLLTRISDFMDSLLDNAPPVEMCGVMDSGLSEAQRTNLELAKQHLGELTASTIHGFAQRLVQPYPVEADVDPGARIIDPAEVNLVWEELLNQYLRDELDSDDTEKAIVAFFENDSRNARSKIVEIAGHVRKHAEYDAAASVFDVGHIERLLDAVTAFQRWVSSLAFVEETTKQLADELECFAESYKRFRESLQSSRALTLFALDPTTCSAHTQKKSWRRWGRKSKWENAARDQGASKAEGARISGEGDSLYQDIGEAWIALHGELGAHTFRLVTEELQNLVERYRQYKRTAALMDFDDLLLKARTLLRNNDAVKTALAERYRHVLVDEFQDTDPVQVEILWRLCGDGQADQPWKDQVLRPGTLFCVGDPKQAIYRFRGADVNTYIAARDEIVRHFPENIVEVTANFRSAPNVLEWVNEQFEAPLSQEGQPGFTTLSATKPVAAEPAGVYRLDVEVDSERDKPSAPECRNAEAAAVADLCHELIGSYRIPTTSGDRVAKAGDIALLAPVGTDLWRYERELEGRNIPVASQAGKGFFRRQEAHDLIAITRTIADARDTVALGALLRGPLVGLTEQELLDIVESFPKAEEGSSEPKLTLWTPLDWVGHPLAKEVLARLQGLARESRSTTPFELLAQAVEELRVRPVLSHRHSMGAERPLANVDLFLEMAQAYSGRGLPAFARDMRLKWEDGESELEGRPDSEEQAVHMITMHSSKGLEWPIVILINSISKFNNRFDVLLDREQEEFHFSIGSIKSESYETMLEAERTQHTFEMTRLLYVACTRPEQILVCPNLLAGGDGYLKLLDLDMESIPALDAASLPESIPEPSVEIEENRQDSETFSEEALRVSNSYRDIVWESPSSHEKEHEDDSSSAPPTGDDDDGQVTDKELIKGGPLRGTLLHKLMEEVISGEIKSNEDKVKDRAVELLNQLNSLDPDSGTIPDIDPDEVTECILRTCGLPEIAAVLAELLPEYPLYGESSTSSETQEVLIAGIADAVLPSKSGEVRLVIDWKSDVQLNKGLRAKYRRQVYDYLVASEAKEGLIVYMTTGESDRVTVPMGTS